MKVTSILFPLFATLAGAGAAIPAFAQTGSPAPSVTVGLTAHGHGELKVKPDIAYATINIVTESRDQAQAISDNSGHMKDVIAALKASMVADRDIETQFYTVQPQYDYRSTPATLIDYQVSNATRVTIHDLPKIGLILDKATRAGATSIDDVSFDVVDRLRAEGDALTIAIANARSKADLMAGAAGVELGKIVSVGQDEPTDDETGPIFAGALKSPAPQQTQIAPQMIDVEADVTIVYSIASRHTL